MCLPPSRRLGFPIIRFEGGCRNLTINGEWSPRGSSCVDTENWVLFSFVCTKVVVRMDYHRRILSWQDTCTEVVTNKAHVLPSRSSTLPPCPAYLNVFKVNATETRMDWRTPHPFKANRQKLPNSREQAMKELCPFYHHVRETLWMEWNTLSLPWRGFF